MKSKTGIFLGKYSTDQFLMEIVLFFKGAQKLGIETVTNVVLEEDGSEVDGDYFTFLPPNSILQLLTVDETWRSAEGM